MVVTTTPVSGRWLSAVLFRALFNLEDTETYGVPWGVVTGVAGLPREARKVAAALGMMTACLWHSRGQGIV